MSRKTSDFLQLLTYINKGKERENTAIFHNLRTDPDDIAIIAQEFSDNARYSAQRKNGVICYHEILSFPDTVVTGDFSPEILENLAQEYLRLRAPNALGYAKLHRDTEHPHIHFCISGNQIRHRRKNRLSRAEFGAVKTQLRNYCQARYPELTALLSPAPPKKQKPRTQRKPERKYGQTVKAALAEKILDIFALASNQNEAMSRLSEAGIEPYRRGKEAFYGVVYQGKKYRLMRLEIKEQITARAEIWRRTQQRLEELDVIVQTKKQLREIPLGR